MLQANHCVPRRYSVCVRPSAGFCCVQYSVCAGVAGAFSLDATTTAMVDDNCANTDYVGISGNGN